MPRTLNCGRLWDHLENISFGQTGHNCTLGKQAGLCEYAIWRTFNGVVGSGEHGLQSVDGL